ncbi:MAG TPA: hypothetical protein VFB85_06795 [Vicinamibacterales bacterium]|jgi:hypothetical protein|nr:hypothetical protein [Vicinamibacterales bacterium]
MTRRVPPIAAMLALAALAGDGSAYGQGRGAPPPPSAKASAPLDLTGYWVSVVNEDWRFRMITPAKGDYGGIPITKEALQLVNAWNPSADEAAGEQCKSYGAAAIMRVPGRIHVTWQDDETLKVDTDAGTQTRLFRFGPARAATGQPTWQGTSAARWEAAGGRGGAPASGSLTVVTTNMRAGYLRKNGVPYSENARVTEYFDVAPQGQDGRLLVVTTVVDDPRYLSQPFIVSSHFKKEPDGSKWDPTPCSATW